MSYDPNIEASTLFISRILPIILQREPDSIFHIVGDKPSKEVNNMASNSVRIYGRVPDVRPYYKDAEVVVVPLVSGGGTRLKILEAAASGKAIVTTSVGMEGLFFHDGDDLVVADTPEAFAWAVSDLIGDVDRQRELGARARQTSLAYDWNSIGVRLYESVESLMGGPPRWRY
jgi:polysaccharide biosynthesis protein PslH